MKRIPMLDLKLEYEYMKKDIDFAIRKCFEHQQWILGPEVKELEKKAAGYLGVKHCVGVSSGTEALLLSLRSLAIKTKGKEFFNAADEIITTPFTFSATGEAILRAGATPVFIDIDLGTYNIEPSKIMSYLKKDASRAAGIIPVHLYGHACNMDEIMEIARAYGLFVLEDTAQAFGGMWKNKKLGTIGTIGGFSFFPSKNLGGFGDSGMVATNDDELAGLVRMLLNHGGKDKYDIEHIGYNARMDTMQAATLLSKMNYIDEFNDRRRKIAKIYDKGLCEIRDLILPENLSPAASRIYHQYTIRLLNGNRDELQKHLEEKGISTKVYYPMPLHKMKVFEERSRVSDSLENAEIAAKVVVSLPIGPLLTEEEAGYIIDCIKKGCAYADKRIFS